MRINIARHALDRVPLSIIFDDSTLLVNLNYYFMRDRNLVDGEARRWEDVPVVHPESFTREFAEWCLEHGVRGKYSVVPCPAALGRIDEGLPLFSRAQQESRYHARNDDSYGSRGSGHLRAVARGDLGAVRVGDSACGG